MKITRICLSALLVLAYFTSNSQDRSTDSVTLKITISSQVDKKVETMITFENTSTRKVRKFRSDKNGNAECVLATGESYMIRIPESTDSYEYTIPEFAFSPLVLEFKFNLKEKIQSAIGIRLFNDPGIKEISIVSKTTPVSYFKVASDTVHLQLDPGEVYTLSAKGVVIDNGKIKAETGGRVYSYILHFRSPSQAELIWLTDTESVIEVIYEDFYGKPAKDELVIINGKAPGSEYKLKTGINGRALAIVPVNDQYQISLKHFPGIFGLNIVKEENAILTKTVRLKYPSSGEYEFQKKERARIIAARDSMYISFDKMKEKELAEYQKEAASKSAAVMAGIKTDPAYFQNNDLEVCAVLHRNRSKWKNKMIVTDVTGSMYPYMSQVGLWHLLEMMNNERSDYVFFNDGNNIPDHLKKIGSTGGIYFISKSAPDSVIKLMYKAMQNGSGGDAPENNIEALLEAVKHKSEHSELVLIADSYSPVKDITLLHNIKTPVRVILCGAKSGHSDPDYLELAYRTGGSVHTIEEDIINLSDLHNEETITIAGTLYKFINGRFFPISKKL